MVRGLITAIAAAAVLGVATPATARVDNPAFDVTLNAKLERSWTWEGQPHECGPVGGRARRSVTIRTAKPAPVGRSGGAVAIVGTLELQGRADGWELSPAGSCLETSTICPARRTPISGSVRLTLQGGVVRLGGLRYRTTRSVGCAPDVPAVRAALRTEPRLESVFVRDRQRRLQNERIPRITATAHASPSARLTGDVTGEVRTSVRWSLELNRR